LALHGVARWRPDLVTWLRFTFEVAVSPTTLRREFHAMGNPEVGGGAAAASSPGKTCNCGV